MTTDELLTCIETALDHIGKAESALRQATDIAYDIEHHRGRWATRLLGDLLSTASNVALRMSEDYRHQAKVGCPSDCHHLQQIRLPTDKPPQDPN